MKLTPVAMVVQTPFRQMVWTLMHQILNSHVKAMFEETESDLKNEFTKTLKDSIQPKVKEVGAAMFQQLATSLSMGMMNSVLAQASRDTHVVLTTAFQRAGIATADIPIMRGDFFPANQNMPSNPPSAI